jgi:hypothetical protein
VLSLPPAFVLSQDQTLKFETLCSSGCPRAAGKWSLANIDESPCAFDVSIEALASQNANDRCFGCPQVSLRTARTHAACVSLSFFHNVKEPEGFEALNLVQPTRFGGQVLFRA